MNFWQKSVIFFATGGFSGKIPYGPGTFGTIVGLPLCFILSRADLAVSGSTTLVFIFFAIWMAQEAERLLNLVDPGCIVIDEIAGILVALWGLPFNSFTVVSGFVIFRILDILKPFPISYLDRRLSGGTGVVMDDVAAGILCNLILRIISRLTGSS
jgi:phosphatidylglycerophosphatase A